MKLISRLYYFFFTEALNSIAPAHTSTEPMHKNTVLSVGWPFPKNVISAAVYDIIAAAISTIAII